MAVTKQIIIDVDVDSKDVKKLNKELDNTQKEVNETNKATGSLTNTIDKMTGGAVTKFKGMISGVKNLATGFKGLRIAIIATGIGALLVAIVALGALFTKTQRGADLLSKGMAAIGAAVSVVIDRMSGLGDALLLLFDGDFSGAFNKAKESVSGLTDEIVRETMAAWDLQDALNAVRDSEIGLIVTNAKRRQEIARNRLIAEDETKAIKDRIAALDEATRLEGLILEDQIRIAKEKARIAESQVGLGESMATDNEAVANAQAVVIDLGTQSLNFQKRIITRRNALIREGNAKARADREEERKLKEAEPRGGESVLDTGDLQSGLETDLELSQVYQDKKTLQDQEASDKRMLIARLEADAKKAILMSEIDNVSNGFALLGQLAGKNEALQKAALIGQSLAGIARVVINTQAANAAATAKYALLPGGIALAAAEITANNIGAGIGIASNVVATAKALSALGGGSSGGGNVDLGNGRGGSSAPSFNVVGNSGTSQLAQTLQSDDEPIRAYVVGNDVTSQQSADRSIIETASLG